MNAPSREDVTVNWEAVEWSTPLSTTPAATLGVDFTAGPDGGGTVTIDAGATSAFFGVESLGDSVFEGDERFGVRLSRPGYVVSDIPIRDSFGVGTILDDDVTVSVAGATAPEGAPVRFVVRLDNPLSRPVTVDWGTVEYPPAEDAATAGDDFVAASGSVTVPAGQTEASFEVATLSDADVEVEERFGLRAEFDESGSPDGRIRPQRASFSTRFCRC